MIKNIEAIVKRNADEVTGDRTAEETRAMIKLLAKKIVTSISFI